MFLKHLRLLKTSTTSKGQHERLKKPFNEIKICGTYVVTHLTWTPNILLVYGRSKC
jgi:hypothetical protein